MFEDLSVSISMSLLVAAVPVIEFLSPPRPLKSRGDLLAFAVFITVALLVATGDMYNWGILRINTAMTLVVLPYGVWVLWKLSGRNWLYLTALTLALALMMNYWIAALLETGDPLELLTLPLLTVLFIGILLAPLVLWIWNIAKRRKDRRISGPGMQAAAMAIMFLPIILTAVFVPGSLGLSQAWSNVSLAIAGILLSAVVSEPLRRFLLAWGNLSPEPRRIYGTAAGHLWARGIGLAKHPPTRLVTGTPP